MDESVLKRCPATALRQFSGDPGAVERPELRLAVARLAPGSLAGDAGRVRSFLREERIDVPDWVWCTPASAVGTTIAVAGDGQTVRYRVVRARERRDPAWLDRRALSAARDAEAAALVHVGCWPADVATLAIAPDEPKAEGVSKIEGASVGLSVALALISDWLDQPLPADLAATGALRIDGTMEAAGRIEEKCAALQAERPYVTRLLIPAGSAFSGGAGLQIIPVKTLADAANQAGLDLTRPSRAPLVQEALSDAVREAQAFSVARQRDTAWLLPRLELLLTRLDAVPPQRRSRQLTRTLVTLLSLLIEHRTHAGLADRAVVLHDRLAVLLASHADIARLDASGIAQVENVYASALIDVGRLERAREAVALALTPFHPEDPEALRLGGTLGRIAAHAGREDEAITILDRVTRLQSSEMPRESNIPRCHLVACLARAGQVGRARAALEAGRLINYGEATRGWGAANDVYLELEEARVLLAEGQTQQAADLTERHIAASVGPWPRLAFIRRHAEAMAALGRPDAASTDAMRAGECVASEGRVLRWIAALVAATAARAALVAHRDDLSEPLLRDVRAACAEMPGEADAPWAAPARRVAAGEHSVEVLEQLCRCDIY